MTTWRTTVASLFNPLSLHVELEVKYVINKNRFRVKNVNKLNLRNEEIKLNMKLVEKLQL